MNIESRSPGSPDMLSVASDKGGRLCRSIKILLFVIGSSPLLALSQQPEVAVPVLPSGQSDTTITYQAAFFQQWNPISVVDMIDRIPGIAIALDEGDDGNTRGLGGAENILINGQRISGKNNNASEQLSRISFDQVSRIEIIRGTSSSLVGISNEGQIVNIVTDSNREMSTTVEVSANRFQDGHVAGGGAFILNGSHNALDYRLSVENEPAYQIIETREESLTGDYRPNDLRIIRERTDQSNQVLNSNLDYQFAQGRDITLNLLYEDTDPPRTLARTITDFTAPQPTVSREEEAIASTRDNWEIGADYNHVFDDDGQLQLLWINNRQDHETLRKRFQLSGGQERLQDLRLRNDVVNRERIVRSAYTRPVAPSHDLEIGGERAMTRLATELALARLQSSGPNQPSELTPVDVPNANSTIEEIRYEGFLVHHWQLNSRMQLESTLLYESSEITQSGDIDKSRDFDFIRPKFDYRFDITPTLQLQLTAERFVAQLRFSDFAAATDPRDEERDTVAGNPELEQQKSWRYATNVEYRFMDDRGVLNARAFYWDMEDVIGKIDATPSGGPLRSVSGNIGDGEVSGLEIDSSFRITPNMLVSGSVLARASEVRDPFTGEPRRIPPNDRGHYTLGFRHDIPDLGFNYGADYRGAPQGNRPLYDINRIDDIEQREDLSLFVEKTSLSPLNLSLRFEARNMLDDAICTERLRFDGRISSGVIGELEKRCDRRGRQYMMELRGTF